MSLGTIDQESFAKGVGVLVISRKKNERVMIGTSIVLTVVEIRGDKVRLGIEAPKEWPVHREEVFDAIRRNHENLTDPPAGP